MVNPPPIPAQVQEALDRFDAPRKSLLEQLRALIFDVAAGAPEAGPVTETLKWGQPSYASARGTPLRLGLTADGNPAVFAHCQSRVIPEARSLFAEDLQFEGNRAIVLRVDAPIPEDALRQVIHAALTYRLNR
ncbi:MAG: DUF1801 domain-containing protein [Marivita sp.]|uniref:DUF1801 domain-containing protein n=1 Tax=Marivita sp. TaxID=2003365 RepID=UPI0025C17B6C|nr:DUF1801 domain-containing protein [Marivita sp.]MCI5109726.1 DUF1801 domain-containing protein [Marivita sp.]